MLIPNLERALIDPRKLTEYLLAPDHPEGGPKAAFFIALGFSAARPEDLGDALRAHAANDVAAFPETPFGIKYVVEAPFTGRNGRHRMLRSIWLVQTGEDFPRFVTAYPLEVS